MKLLDLTGRLSAQKKEKAALGIQLEKEEVAAVFEEAGSRGDSL